MIGKIIMGTVLSIGVLLVLVCLAIAGLMDDETWDDDAGKGE